MESQALEVSPADLCEAAVLSLQLQPLGLQQNLAEALWREDLDLSPSEAPLVLEVAEATPSDWVWDQVRYLESA